MLQKVWLFLCWSISRWSLLLHSFMSLCFSVNTITCWLKVYICHPLYYSHLRTKLGDINLENLPCCKIYIFYYLTFEISKIFYNWYLHNASWKFYVKSMWFVLKVGITWHFSNINSHSNIRPFTQLIFNQPY